jgi:hypothetical protein
MCIFLLNVFCISNLDLHFGQENFKFYLIEHHLDLLVDC